MIRGRSESVPIVVLSTAGDEPERSRRSTSVPTIIDPSRSDGRACCADARALRLKLQVQGERPVFRSGDLAGRSGAPDRQGRRARSKLSPKGI